MKEKLINYETFLTISNAISHSKEPEEVALMTVEGVKTALDIKGCALFLLNEGRDELQLTASYGLSDEYLQKGPVSALHSIAQTLHDGPVAIYDVNDDPRLQYPEAARKEGIASILSVPIRINDTLLGAMRVYSSEPWEMTLSDVNFVNGLAQIAGLSTLLATYTKGVQKTLSDVETLQDVQHYKDSRTTPYEGVPQSFPAQEYQR